MSAKDDDMRIEVEDGAFEDPEVDPDDMSEIDEYAETEAPEDADAPAMTEEEMVAAAIAAGEAAAEEEMARDATRLADERDELARKLASAEEDVRAAQAQAQTAVERQLRLQADWDNYRKRTAAEREAERERAAERVVEQLLPVIDDLERALEHAGAAEGNAELAQFVEGVSAVNAKLLAVLAREGVEPINPVGEAFDPLVHRAVGRVDDPEAYDETVAQVYQKGYRMGGKVIRSAMVTVTYGGPKRPAEGAGDPPSEDANN